MNFNENNEEKCYTLITGACGGLGRAFVLECAKNRDNLILIGTSREKLNNLVIEFSSIFQKFCCDVKTYVCNLSLMEERKELIENVSNEKLKIVKLINNAGVITEGNLERFSDEEVANTINVNCVGTLDLTKKLLSNRDKNHKFEVLTVSSIADAFPIPYMAVYSATKAFLVSVMTALSIEYKNQNVIFTTVCPGGIPTTKEMKDSIKSMGIGGKLSSKSPEKVAKIALKGLKRKKKMVIVGGFNKFLIILSKPFSKNFLAKITGRIWKNSQNKRNF